jgi:ABC-2 type transport system permease protein
MAKHPIYWVAFFLLPLFCFAMFSGLMEEGLPVRVPAAIVDKDHTSISRSITQNLAGMQMVSIDESCNSFTQARHLMQEGKIFGYFLIPENFEADLLSGRSPEITYYTNMTYYVPASLLYKTFKTTALYTKAGITLKVLESTGASKTQIMPLLQPVNIIARPLHNPEMNYAIYLCNSFMPGVLELMIMLLTCFSLGQETKYGSSVELLRMADGSIIKALFGKLLPQTIVWWVMALFMEMWLFKWNAYPMNGSWLWITLSELMFVLACQGFALFIFGLLPNLRLSLSASALFGILAFSVAAFSFPVESMYPSIGIFSWILPTRYNFLIYIDQALNGIDIYYSRLWFVAYIVFMLIPLTVLWRIKRNMLKPVYVP